MNTDTIQKIADDLKALAIHTADHGISGWNGHDKINAIASRLRALSARASAGEGGEKRFIYTYRCMACRFEADMCDSAKIALVKCPCGGTMQRKDNDPIASFTAAPQPAQAGASGGGDGWWEGLGNEVIDGEACILYQHTTTGAQLWCRKSEHEKVDALLKGRTTPASPATGEGYPTEVDALALELVSVTEERDFLRRQLAATPQPAAAQEPQWVGWLRNDVEDDDALAAAPQPQECRHEWFPDPDLGEGGGYLYCRKCDVTRRAPKDTTPPAHGDGEVVLPELPFPDTFTSDSFNGMKLYFTAKQMREYARQVLTTRPTPEAQEARDAARWRALIGSARIRVLGSAGLLTDTRPDGGPWNGYAHIGLELWTKHEAGNEPTDAVEWLTKYTDAALALPAQGEG